ncbi:MAG: protein kinase domain-containing protein [Myxococcota bacterium]
MGLRTQAGDSPPTRTSGNDDPLVGQLLDGRYRIGSLLAQGGMGKVYRAEQLSLGRQVAIKTLHLTEQQAGHDPSFRQRFALEAAATSRLSSPHTVTIFDYGRTESDLYYIVMELVDGQTLSQLMRREGKLPPARALNITRQLALALREAHRRGIVHRDIKPANILLTRDGLETVKVLDFGIAKMLQPEPMLSVETPMEITRSGTLLGTPEYMAPEAMTGKADHRSDLYSLGVVLYLMLAGKLPYKGGSPAETIMMVLHEAPPKLPMELGLPPTLILMIEKLMARNPEDRFQSVDELWATLMPISQGLGIDFSQLTQTRTEPLELEPELLLPLTHAGEMPVGWSYAWLPSWLRSRRQLSVMLGTACGVLLVGVLLFKPPTQTSAPRPEASPPLRSLSLQPSALQGTTETTVAPSSSSTNKVLAEGAHSTRAEGHPADMSGASKPSPALSSAETGGKGATPPETVPATAENAAASPVATSEEPPRSPPARKKARTSNRSAPAPAEEEVLPEGYKPSPY